MASISNKPVEDSSTWMKPRAADSILKGLNGVIMSGRPCKVMAVDVSKTGKHGHAKVTVTGIDLFDGKKYQQVWPASATCFASEVKKTTYQLVSINDGDVELLDDRKESYTLPLHGAVAEALAKEYVRNAPYAVTVMVAVRGDSPERAVFIEQIISYKKA